LARLREASVLLFFLALAILYSWPLGADMTGRTLWGLDPMIDLYTVHWLASHAFEPQQLFAGNIFFPAPHAVLYSDLSFGTALFLIPLRAFVHDPISLYNAAVWIALAFAGWSFHTLVRRLTGSLWAGLLAGTLSAFASHQMLHIEHLNLLSVGWLAIFLAALHALVARPSLAASVVAGVAFVLSALSTGYYAVAAVLLALVFFACHARWWRRSSLVALAAAALLAALLMAPYVLAYATLRASDPMRRPLDASLEMAFKPARDLGSHGLVYRRLVGAADARAVDQQSSFPGQGFFPGLIAPVLALVALRRRRPHAGFYAVAIGVLVWVALGPRALLYRALFAIPPGDSMRHPFSFAAVAALLLPVLAGLGWACLDLARRPWAGPLVVALAIVETLPPAPRLETWAAGVPPAYEALATLAPGATLEIPVLNYQTLLWAARHGRPVLNGQGAFVPRATLKLKRAIEVEWLVQAPADVDASTPTSMLAAMGCRYVIVPVGRWADVRPLAEAFDRSHAYVLAAVAKDGDRIYALR
jgi:hypothetical protein